MRCSTTSIWCASFSMRFNSRQESMERAAQLIADTIAGGRVATTSRRPLHMLGEEMFYRRQGSLRSMRSWNPR